MRNPNLNALRMFDAAARHLNFRRAADELNLTQGAVAQQVRHLEADLGCPLFHRVARGLTLTNAGRGYHVPVRRALAMIDNATRMLRAESTRITLSVPPSFASKWLVPRLATFSALHPEIEVLTAASEELANFHSDGVDIAIRQGRPAFSDDLHVEMLAPLELNAVSSPGYAARIGPIHRIEDFAALQLIQDSHRHWEKLFDDIGLAAPKQTMTFNQTALAMDAAASGQGIALAPKLLLSADLEQRKLVQLWRQDRQTADGYYLLHPNADDRNRTVREKFVDWLLAEIAGAHG